MKKVLIIEAQMKQYRVPFYQGLNAALAKKGVVLTVAYSDPPSTEAARKDTSELQPDYGLKVKSYWLWRERIILQPLLRNALTSDLVVIDQANKFFLNHVLLPLSCVGLKRIAFIGHGTNRSNGRWRLSEWYRVKALNWATWWFAYTAATTRYLVANGVPADKITTVCNSIDTNEIREVASEMSSEDKRHLREMLGISSSAPVGVYCGAMDKHKKVSFLIQAAQIVRQHLPDFHLFLIGAGPEADNIAKVTSDVPWIHTFGPRFGKDKARLLAISDACLVPGAVGLVILDAFAAGLPLLTTSVQTHGPEIEYLQQETNGLQCEPDLASFASMVTRLLSDREHLSRLQGGAAEAGARYTMENMVTNVRDGICECLGIDGTPAPGAAVGASMQETDTIRPV